LVVVVVSSTLGLVACDGGDGTSGITQDGGDVPDVGADAVAGVTPEVAVDTGDTADTTEPMDTAMSAETSIPVDTNPEETTEPADTTPADTTPADAIDDTGPIDAGPADTGPMGDADAGCSAECLEVEPGLPGVAITLQGMSVNAPVLRGILGQSAPLGRFELVATDVYPKGAVSSFVSLGVTDGGSTNGAAELEADTWGVYLDLDLAVALSAFGQSFDQAARQELVGGGCYAIAGAMLESDLSHCAVGWPDDVEVPDEAEFEYDNATGVLEMKLVLSKAFLLSLVPAEYAGLAGLAITGPLALVLTFEAAGPL